MRTKGKPHELEKVRLIAANLIDQELKTADIARALDVDDQTIRQWRRVYRRLGRPGLLARRHPGGRPRLSAAQKAELVAMLARPPLDYGLDRHLWTTPLIARLIHERFGVRYHHDYVGTLLHDLGLSCQKPARRALERDEARIDAWRRVQGPALLKKEPTASPSSSPTRPAS